MTEERERFKKKIWKEKIDRKRENHCEVEYSPNSAGLGSICPITALAAIPLTPIGQGTWFATGNQLSLADENKKV